MLLRLSTRGISLLGFKPQGSRGGHQRSIKEQLPPLLHVVSPVSQLFSHHSSFPCSSLQPDVASCLVPLLFSSSFTALFFYSATIKGGRHYIKFHMLSHLFSCISGAVRIWAKQKRVADRVTPTHFFVKIEKCQRHSESKVWISYFFFFQVATCLSKPNK